LDEMRPTTTDARLSPGPTAEPGAPHARDGTRPDHRFAAGVVVAYLPVAVFAITHHEMWRDELHCWLVARDSATPWDVVRNRAYDGHPPLWYWLLWVIEKVTHDPRAMQIAHVAIATAVVWVFASRAPFPRAVRWLFPFGYFIAYEYVAISRCYGLALLFALALCAHHPARFARPFVTAALLTALALTATVSTVVAAAYAVALAVDGLGMARRGQTGARRAWIPIAGATLACGAAALCTWPPADSTVTHVAWPSRLPSDDGATRIVAGLVPIPRADFFFWNSNALLSFEPFRRVALLVSIGIAAWILLAVSRCVFATVLFGVGTVLLVALFAFVYGGDVRHHGFFFVLFLMAAWIAATAPPSGPRSLRSRVFGGALTPTVAAVLFLHLPAAAIALDFDYRYVFSSGRRAADALRAHGLENALFVAEVDFPATAVLGQLGPKAVAYSPRTGRTFSFVKWTRERHWDPSDRQTLDYAAALGAARGEDVIAIMNRPLLPALVEARGVERIAELFDSMIEEENFYIYRVSAHGRAFRGAETSDTAAAPVGR
jgi:hypothetical protein